MSTANLSSTEFDLSQPYHVILDAVPSRASRQKDQASKHAYDLDRADWSWADVTRADNALPCHYGIHETRRRSRICPQICLKT